jgi:hypothetical protein
MGRVVSIVKRVFIGRPSLLQAEEERLTKFKALAVLSSNAISSVARYRAIHQPGCSRISHLGLTLPISFTIVGLLAIVAISYENHSCLSNDGGSYIVAKDNLGTCRPGSCFADD